MRIYGLVLIALLLPLRAIGEDIKLLTWNVYMLPRPIKFSRQLERTKVIRDELKKVDHDVIVLQEAFYHHFSRTIRNALKTTHPFQRKLGRTRKFWQVMDSGVLIVSKFPFKVLGYRFFKSCASADCFASKGVLLVEIILPKGKKLQLAATHMQSGQKENRRRIREKQTNVIKHLMQKHQSPGIPQLLMGDLNIDGLQELEFHSTTRKLSMEPGVITGELISTKSTDTECFGKANTSKQTWYDHSWFRVISGDIIEKDKQITPIRGVVNRSECDLSDHLPVSVTYSL